MEELFNKAYGQINRFCEKRIVSIVPKAISPNAITLSRIFFVAPIVFFLFSQLIIPAVIFFVFAALLDYVDGALARGRNEESELGKFLDPIVDKIFFCSLAIAVSAGLINTYTLSFFASLALFLLVGLSFNVEVILAITRLEDYSHNQSIYQLKERKNLKADWSGKLKFNLQIAGTGAMLLAYHSPKSPIIWLTLALLALSLPLAMISLINKLKRN